VGHRHFHASAPDKHPIHDWRHRYSFFVLRCWYHYDRLDPHVSGPQQSGDEHGWHQAITDVGAQQGLCTPATVTILCV
jgi:hypothetical protein